MSSSGVKKSENSIHIREVSNHNLDAEFKLIRNILDDYPYIGLTTNFPEVFIRPVENFNSIEDYNYQTLKQNVDNLKLIQLSLAFCDENGNLPTCGTDNFCIWQFNIEEGIDCGRFGQLLMSSGVVLNYSMNWITFDGRYDVGYLLKLLTCRDLPDTQADFFSLIELYFPVLYDIKYLMKFCNCGGGLNELAELLDVERIGTQDSLLACSTFLELKHVIFNGDTSNYAGVLFGLAVQDA